jgi:uncharacterized membrane protein
MENNGSFKTVVMEDGSHTVVRTDPRNPRLLEVIAIFYDAARAQDYVDFENKRSAEQPESPPPVTPARHTPASPKAAPRDDVSGLSERQSAVLKALRTKMNENRLVTAKAAELAGAANIPLGSLHSVLQSLEKKQLIKSVRAGSARVPATFQVL